MADDDTIELEISEDDIIRYLHDDAGNEIGLVVLEGGKEVEYLYAEDDEDGTEDVSEGDSQATPLKDGQVMREDAQVSQDGATSESTESEEISYKKVQSATDDMNAIFKDGVKVASEFKGAYDDIKEALDFKDLLDVKSWLK